MKWLSGLIDRLLMVLAILVFTSRIVSLCQAEEYALQGTLPEDPLSNQFSLPYGIAIDEASQTVFVVDHGNNRCQT